MAEGHYEITVNCPMGNDECPLADMVRDEILRASDERGPEPRDEHVRKYANEEQGR